MQISFLLLYPGMYLLPEFGYPRHHTTLGFGYDSLNSGKIM